MTKLIHSVKILRLFEMKISANVATDYQMIKRVLPLNNGEVKVSIGEVTSMIY